MAIEYKREAYGFGKGELEKLLSASFDQGLSDVVKYFPEVADDVFYDRKKDALKEMVLMGILDWPTMANIYDWYQTAVEDIEGVQKKSNKYPDGLRIKLAPLTIGQQCHASTALNWIVDQELEIHSGFSDQTHFHSWLYSPKKNIVYEPTEIPRSTYRGFAQDPVKFVLDEVHAIESLKTFSPEVEKAYELYSSFVEAHK